jgi:hypothetical protein
MPSKKVNRVHVSDGPVLVDTTFVDDSPEGEAAWYLNQGEIAPRRGVALGISTLFSPLAAAMRGKSLEQVEALILSSERCLSDFMRQAREQAQCNRRSSPENLMPNPEGLSSNEESRNGFSNAIDDSSPQVLLADTSENLSNLFN